MSGSLQILSFEERAILDYPAIRRALLTIHAPHEVSEVITSPPPRPQSSVQVRPDGAPSFSVRLSEDGSNCGMDGLPAQNAPVVVALRAQIPPDAGRIFAVDLMHVESFAELPWGITVEQLAVSWRPLGELEDPRPAPQER